MSRSDRKQGPLLRAGVGGEVVFLLWITLYAIFESVVERSAVTSGAAVELPTSLAALALLVGIVAGVLAFYSILKELESPAYQPDD